MVVVCYVLVGFLIAAVLSASKGRVLREVVVDLQLLQVVWPVYGVHTCQLGLYSALVLCDLLRGQLRENAGVAVALCAALAEKRIAGAAIDVAVKEPIASDCPLLDAPNLIITPHIAGSSDDVQVVGTRMVVEALSDWLAGRKPAHSVVYV